MTDKRPKHVALIVDGNRRWARAHQMPYFAAYKVAGTNLVDNVCYAAQQDVPVITAFLFSTENWNREAQEVASVFKAFEEILYEHTPTFIEYGVRVGTIGDTLGLPDNIRNAIEHTVRRTSAGTASDFVMAFNYGGRWDIVNAVKRLQKDDLNTLTEEAFADLICTAPFGDPDLLIRTGGEQRVSNFMMWQLAYTELYFSKLMWPDFHAKDLEHALQDYAERNRRLGST